ncbi:hypothetical protein GX51_07761 [Blastomyces parvus]|uniref:Transcription factor domain-containing protein n=1 Tax=Blastomyces parvus TaxID=2060905 RepID=A0A2B7WIJ8_9EURO|nr:hypothetical protein GX51_07761 [Blastomyces parvus]
MPPRARRARLTERRAATTSTRADADAKANGIFHFVNVNPSSELQKSENRSVIRSHASKYIWRQHRAGRTDGNNLKSSTVESAHSLKEPLISPPDSYGTMTERPWPLSPEPPVDEALVSILSPPDEHNISPPDDEDITKPAEVQREDGDVDNDGDVTQLSLKAQSAQSGVISTADIYKHESNAIAGPFNQLLTYIGEPGNQFPSMLGSSAISKLMRYAAFDLWPGLVLGARNRKWTRDDVAQSWLDRAMSHPALFTAFLYGAAGHLQTRKRLESACVAPQTREEKLEQIVCESETIKQLNKMMLDPQQTCTDEIILAVLCMAFNRIDYSKWTSDIDPAPKAPLRNLQWLDVYGGLSLNDQHIKGLFALLHTRGGLDKLTLPGLAETLSTSAIMLSTKYLAKPRLPFFPIFKDSATGKTPMWPSLSSNTCSIPIEMINLVSDIQPAPYPQVNSSNNFQPINTSDATEPSDVFTQSNLPTPLTTVLRNMQNYNAVVNLHSQGLLPYLDLPVIADRRNWVQYELLSLSSIHEINEYKQDTDPSNPTPVICQQQEQIPPLRPRQARNYKIYEPIRLAAMVYSMLVVYPLPAANRPFTRLSRMMKAALIAAEIENIIPTPTNPYITDHCWSSATEMLLWVMVLGTMAARNTPSEDWFVERSRDAMRVVGVGSWEQLKRGLERVMWMDCVCDVGGLAVWNEVNAGS